MMTLVAVVLVLLAVIGAPFFALFGGAALTLFMQMQEGNWASPAIDVFGVSFAENPTLLTIPLFTFAGYLLAESGMPRRLVALSSAWLGWMPGGLALVCLIASAFFTTFTGGSGVTIIAVGGLLLPAMLKEGYPAKFSYGLVTTAGSLGILFPPSVPLVLYGIIAGLTMNKLLVAGILPGILVVAILAAYGAWTGLKSGFVKTPFVWKRAWASFWIFKWEAAIPVVLVGGLATGLLRIHEASVFTAVYALFIEVFIYRDISIRKDLPRVVVESMTLIGAILVIMACAVGFTGWMIQAEIPMRLLEQMESLITSKFLFLVVVNIFLLIVGMLMDIFTATVVVVPLLLPMAEHYGLDPYHFAIIFLLNLEIGYLTPPMGINLFVSAIRFARPVTEMYRTVIPFIGVLIFALIIVSYVPIITTWLPGMLKDDNIAAELKAEAEADEGAMMAEDWDAFEEPDAGADGGTDAGADGGPAKDGGPEAKADEKPAEGAKEEPGKPVDGTGEAADKPAATP
jgi:C4-dicarboxylate transporter, DctM subunit